MPCKNVKESFSRPPSKYGIPTSQQRALGCESSVVDLQSVAHKSEVLLRHQVVSIFCLYVMSLSACEEKQHIGCCKVKMRPCCAKQRRTRQFVHDGHGLL